jgi:3-isopropylmalate/(R)-2-methylmalate dehydratase small subunit
VRKLRKVKGRVWKFGANVDTDQIIPAEYLVTGDAKELARHVFEKARPGFAEKVRRGDIIVAEENFGCGSSREHAPRALMGAGIACVVAKSFARIFFRNAINIGLPVVECDVSADEGDELEIDFERGVIKNLTTGGTHVFKPLPGFLLSLLTSGGLVEYTKKRLSIYE